MLRKAFWRTCARYVMSRLLFLSHRALRDPSIASRPDHFASFAIHIQSDALPLIWSLYPSFFVDALATFLCCLGSSVAPAPQGGREAVGEREEAGLGPLTGGWTAAIWVFLSSNPGPRHWICHPCQPPLPCDWSQVLASLPMCNVAWTHCPDTASLPQRFDFLPVHSFKL